MNSTSRGSRLVSSAARSPAVSSTGPEVLLQRHAHFVGDDVRQRGFAQARRAEDQRVVQRLAATARRLDEQLHLLADRRLADVFGQR